MQVSMFIRVHASTKRGWRYHFNPYLQVGSFEVCIDRHGIAIHNARRSFGFILGSGFWKS
jgi:hypothetical protein